MRWGKSSLVVGKVTAHFRNEWYSVRLGNCLYEHALNCVINTNGLKPTDKVPKDILITPVKDLLARSLIWMKEQSVASLGSRHWEQDGWERGQGKVGCGSYCYG